VSGWGCFPHGRTNTRNVTWQARSVAKTKRHSRILQSLERVGVGRRSTSVFSIFRIICASLQYELEGPVDIEQKRTLRMRLSSTTFWYARRRHVEGAICVRRKKSLVKACCVVCEEALPAKNCAAEVLFTKDTRSRAGEGGVEKRRFKWVLGQSIARDQVSHSQARAMRTYVAGAKDKHTGKKHRIGTPMDFGDPNRILLHPPPQPVPTFIAPKRLCVFDGCFPWSFCVSPPTVIIMHLKRLPVLLYGRWVLALGCLLAAWIISVRP